MVSPRDMSLYVSNIKDNSQVSLGAPNNNRARASFLTYYFHRSIKKSSIEVEERANVELLDAIEV